MKKYFRLYRVAGIGGKDSESFSYALPFLSKKQFYDIVNELTCNDFHLITLFPKPGVRVKGASALNWLKNYRTSFPPYSATLRFKSLFRNYIKLYSSGKIVSFFPIESYMINFLKNVNHYKRVLRPYELKPIDRYFENSYFILNWFNDVLKISLKSRFESPKSVWVMNRKTNYYYILEDELIILMKLCRILRPEKIECLFNFPIEPDSIPIIKPGSKLMFKAETTFYNFLSLLENLLSAYEFPINLKRKKSFIVFEDSSIFFKKINSELGYEGLLSIFKELKNYCFDSFHIFNSYHEIKI
ncbi:MAG: hypothetical protein N3F64_04340 [Nitrososphaeria archaeon]|nr:hypothetical protein [Nitrososphaeria archaeon]